MSFSLPFLNFNHWGGLTVPYGPLGRLGDSGVRPQGTAPPSLLSLGNHRLGRFCYCARQSKPALHPKFSENPDMLNYQQWRKSLKNNYSANFVDNPFSKPLIAFISSSHHWWIQNRWLEPRCRGPSNAVEQHSQFWLKPQQWVPVWPYVKSNTMD